MHPVGEQRLNRYTADLKHLVFVQRRLSPVGRRCCARYPRRMFLAKLIHVHLTVIPKNSHVGSNSGINTNNNGSKPPIPTNTHDIVLRMKRAGVHFEAVTYCTVANDANQTAYIAKYTYLQQPATLLCDMMLYTSARLPMHVYSDSNSYGYFLETVQLTCSDPPRAKWTRRCR